MTTRPTTTDAATTATRTVPPPFTVTAPGRLCLFGEHQDYLHLPVIACALPLTCRIRVQPVVAAKGRRTTVTLRVPQLNGAVWTYDLDQLPPRRRRQGQDERCTTKNTKISNNSEETRLDFALSAIYEALDDGWEFATGAECVSTTDIPLQAGCSSSSAFCVAWSAVIAQLCQRPPLSPLQLAQRAHRAEVLHFGAPGGTMDHVTCSFGGLVRIGPDPWAVERLPWSSSVPSTNDYSWVLAYSGEPKDTFKHLHRCKDARLVLLEEKLGGTWDATTSSDNIDTTLSQDEKVLWQATLVNRDTEAQAAQLWREGRTNNLGQLMDRHHVALRDGLCLSTPKLEALRTAALQAGATGFKVVGSGGGGCGVAWVDHNSGGNAKVVETAMQEAGAPQTWIIEALSGGATLVIEDE